MSIRNTQIKKKENDEGRGFIAPMTFWNKLPDLPFQSKLLKCPLTGNRNTAYNAENSLERNYKYEMLPDIDVGVTLDFIDMSVFTAPKELPPLHPADAALIEGVSKLDNKASVKSYPWLRKPQYMTNEMNRDRQAKPEGQVILTVDEIERQLKSEEYRVKKVKEVEQTFEEIKSTPIHPTNPNLKPVSILPFFPDLQLWGNSYTEISFSAHPITEGEVEEKTRKRKNSLMKATYYPNAEQVYLGYYIKKRKLNDDEEIIEEIPDDVDEYQFHREYRYKTQVVDPQTPPYFLLFGENYVSYVPIKARGSMAKEETPSKANLVGLIKLKNATELTEYAREVREKARTDVDG
jgi:RNA polymerase II-associated factor 1